MTQSDPECLELELWGGIEATVNRVHERFFDQIIRTGHQDRIADIELIADLGIRTLRYPLLWERTAPDTIDKAEWHWADQRLETLRELDIRPIIGLLHHGSGPRNTSLVDPSFPERLAEYAGAVAQRYPWITDYTPVNEPLTTARFAALYGHWYPHLHDDASFARALLGQCRGTVLAMEAIRAVNPDARLIQTDDLGKTFSTERLAYQADFENERRWITHDLLTGRLTPDHTMWHWFEWVGVERQELEWFREHECPPAIIGVNTYLSSQRFLDHRVDRYPDEPPGTNGRDTYVDVLANRVMYDGVLGVDGLLEEAWERYGLPLAITEAHNGGGREEQLRWLYTVWSDAQQARRTGADVRAVTVWALLGSFDWAQLVTGDAGQYEPGVFDIRGPAPRPTALATMVRNLVTNGAHLHPALDIPGWWLRPERFYGSVENRPVERSPGTSQRRCGVNGRAILVLGADGPLHNEITAALDERKLSDQIMQLSEAEFTPDDINEIIRRRRPWAVIDVGRAQWWSANPGSDSPCFRVVAAARPGLALACADVEAQLLLFSSDLVFDGSQRDPYTETDPARPFERSGAYCVAAEAILACTWPDSLVIRTGPLFGCTTRSLTASHANRGRTTRFAANDDVISPSLLSDVVRNALDLLVDQEIGVWHLASPGGVSWGEFFAMLGIDTSQRDRNESTGGVPDSKPRHHVLGSERGQIMPLISAS